MKDRIKVLDMIIDDCERDVKDFEGREFNGKTLGELHGILEAKIQALAKIVRELMEESEMKMGPKLTEGTTRSNVKSVTKGFVNPPSIPPQGPKKAGAK